MRSGLHGRVVAITGGARGIGLAVAQDLHAQGVSVAIGDLDGDLAAKEALAMGMDVLGLELDVTDEDSFAAFVAAVEGRFGALDVLVNNAGIMPIGPFLDETVGQAARALDINVGGALIGMKTALPGMVARGSGHIVNMASIAGKSPVPGGLTYAATKAAVVSMTESARVEFGRTGIEFTCVMPSFTNTDLIKGTKGTRGIKTVEPQDVALAIRKSLLKPRPDVFVPAVLGPIAFTQPLMGRRLRDRLNHLLGADRTFLEVDEVARRAYSDRIAPVSAQAERRTTRRKRVAGGQN